MNSRTGDFDIILSPTPKTSARISNSFSSTVLTPIWDLLSELERATEFEGLMQSNSAAVTYSPSKAMVSRK